MANVERIAACLNGYHQGECMSYLQHSTAQRSAAQRSAAQLPYLAFIMSSRQSKACLPDKLLSSAQMQAHARHIVLAHGLELLRSDEAGVGV